METYIAKGLLELQMSLNAQGAIFRIVFSGGSMGSNGVIPARYSTDNPVIKKLIENSALFHDKRIVTLSEYYGTDKKKH